MLQKNRSILFALAFSFLLMTAAAGKNQKVEMTTEQLAAWFQSESQKIMSSEKDPQQLAKKMTALSQDYQAKIAAHVQAVQAAATKSSAETKTTAAPASQAVAKPDVKPAAKPDTKAPAKPIIDFNGAHYELAYQNDGAQQKLFEFVPKGETVENWHSMITVIHDKGGKATPTQLDGIAEATLADMKAKGAFVYNAFSYLDPQSKKVSQVMTFVMSEPTRAEVNIKIIYLNATSAIEAKTYAERLSGKDSKEIGLKVNAFLKNSKDIGTRFIHTEMPAL